MVQAEAEAVYLIRAPKNSQVKEIYERVNQIAKGAAMMTGTEVSIHLEKGCSNILVNHALEEVIYENLKSVGLPEYTQEEYDFARAIRSTIENRVSLADRLEKSYGSKGRQLGAEYDQMGINRFILPYTPSEKAISGSSDVGDVSWVCPTSQIVAATWASGTVEHSWQAVPKARVPWPTRGSSTPARCWPPQPSTCWNTRSWCRRPRWNSSAAWRPRAATNPCCPRMLGPICPLTMEFWNKEERKT